MKDIRSLALLLQNSLSTGCTHLLAVPSILGIAPLHRLCATIRPQRHRDAFLLNVQWAHTHWPWADVPSERPCRGTEAHREATSRGGALLAAEPPPMHEQLVCPCLASMSDLTPRVSSSQDSSPVPFRDAARWVHTLSQRIQRLTLKPQAQTQSSELHRRPPRKAHPQVYALLCATAPWTRPPVSFTLTFRSAVSASQGQSLHQVRAVSTEC